MNASITKKIQASILPHAIYLFAKIEDQITTYANRLGTSPSELARQVVDLITDSPALRDGLRSTDPLLQVRNPSARRASLLTETEVDEVSRGTVPRVKRRMSAAGRRAIKLAQRARWARHKTTLEQSIAKKQGKTWRQRFGSPHWTQTAAGRKKLIKMNKNRKNGKMGPLLMRKAA